MPERRRTRASGNRVGAQRATTQTTLKDHFRRTTDSSTERAQDLHIEHTDPLPEAVDTQANAQPFNPRRLFPIFTKVSSGQEKVINVDDTDVISVSSDAGLSTEPQSSQLTPCSEFSQATTRSIPPSPIAIDDDCSEGDMVPQHVSTSEHMRSQGLTKIKKPTLRLGGTAPFPSACSQHVRGVQQSYTCGQAPIKRSTFPSHRTPDEGTLGFLARLLDDTPMAPPFGICRFLTAEQCEERLCFLGSKYAKSHPVFAHGSVDEDEDSLRYSETWTRRFRPRRANEVLGNERHALYLRDWLRALELRDHLPEEATDKGKRMRRTRRGTKRPRVIREVARKRTNKRRRMGSSDDELDDFVVWNDTDEEEAEDPDDSEDDFTFCQRTLDRLRDTGGIDEGRRDRLNGPTTATNHASREAVHAKFADHLTNTVLITGPPGCGKTAAVYACAEELGWDVFEVYPGIGRRNGTNLDHLVGDVGKNHIVQTVRKRTGRTTAKEVGLDGYLTSGISTLAGSGTQGEPIRVEDETGVPGKGVRQSLVLLEEVDVLFKDDGGFWPAVVEFIRGCQRPVVMTCNDAGLVPVDELPLQTVLVFEPCPSQVAASFLAWLSTREGWHVAHDDLVGLYEATPCLDGEGRARAEGEVVGDLRRSITQLQMVCAGGVQGSTIEKQEEDRRSGEAISAEGMDGRPLERTAREWREMKRESEVMSHVDVCETAKGRGEVVVDEDMVGYVVLREVSHGVHEETGPRLGSRVEAGVVDVVGRLGPSEGVVLDYIPWVRFMAALEGGPGRRRRGRGRG